MFTSRAEFRLHLRIDNADRRLTPHGRRVGLISDASWAEFQAKQVRLAEMKRLLESARNTAEIVLTLTAQTHPCQPERSEAQPNEAEGPAFSEMLSSSLGQSLAQLLKRPEITIEQLVAVLRQLSPEFFERGIRENPCESVARTSSEVRNELKSVETEIKYEGYLVQQQRAMERLKRAEQHSIPEWFDYHSVSGLSREMQEKLTKIRPRTIGQASRIPGVTPAAVSLVNVYIEIQARRRGQLAVSD
jgi:tRNA uridine 5-carboxymethylaminomethyl modification enzyme